MRAAVVIPNWNGARWLVGCLDAIAAQSVGPSTRWWSSTARRPTTRSRSWPTHPLAPRVVRLGENLGFGAASNRGIAAVDADVVALVNTDVVLAPDWLERAIAALAAAPRGGGGGHQDGRAGRPGPPRRHRRLPGTGRGGDSARQADARRPVAGTRRRKSGAPAPERRSTGAPPCWTWAASTSASSCTSRTSTSPSGCGWPGGAVATSPWWRGMPARAARAGSSRPLTHWVARNTLLLVAKSFPVRWAPFVLYRQVALAWHAARERRSARASGGVGRGASAAAGDAA